MLPERVGSVVGQSPIAAWSSEATPPPTLTVSEWADAHRQLPEASAARGSRWRTEDVPYLRGVMDALHEPGVTRVAIQKAAQVGGSEAINNMIGYLIHYDPSPMLAVLPTEDDAEEFSKERIADLIRSTDVLARAVGTKRNARDGHAGESTLAYKQFPGGYLAMGGAKSPNTYARRAVRAVFADDFDRFPATIEGEGDPADLLANRTETFDDGIEIYVSTPTLKNGRIDTLFQRGDQRRYHVRCPFCDRWDWITWSDPKHFHIVFDTTDAMTARLACPADEYGGCGARLDEPTRRHMVARGEWEPTSVAQDPGLISFHLPAMITTLGKASLFRWASAWLSARVRGMEATRAFINTKLAEGWEERGTRMEKHVLMRRREFYGDGVDVPAGAVMLTAGVDVQNNRFEVQVIGWGPAEERWLIDWVTVPGDPKKAETQTSLLEVLNRRYAHASGHRLQISATCIDTGYAAEEIYGFVLANQHQHIFATKGIPDRRGKPIVGKASPQRYGKAPRPVDLWPVNVDDAKGDLMATLAIADAGPGYWHFPMFVDEEYFAQLCAEHRETVYNKLRVAVGLKWVQDRERNEAFDTAVLAVAALHLECGGAQRIPSAIRRLSELLASTPVPAAVAAGTPAPPAPVVEAGGRRTIRSAYLGG